MAAAQESERRRRRAEDAQAVASRCGRGERARGPLDLGLVAAGDDHGREPAVGRHPGLPARFGFGGKKAVAIGTRQRRDHRMGWHRRLQQDAPRPQRPAGAAADLGEELKRPLGRAQIAAGEAEIGIDDADQGQQREVIALGDDLGADDHVDGVRLDPRDQGGGGGGSAQRVAGGKFEPGVGQERRHLLGQALDAGTAGDETAGGTARRTARRHRPAVAAVMALQPALEAVLDQPGGARGAMQAVAAAPAQGQRRVAAPVEEQQRLAAFGQRRGQRRAQGGRDEATRRRAVAAHVDDLDRRRRRAAVARRQVAGAVAAAFDIDEGLQGWRRRDQDDGDVALPGAHHRHVAGMVADAIVLLE